MSSRRSARLIASKPPIQKEPTPEVSPKVANTSRKRKAAVTESPSNNEAAPATPKRRKAARPILPPVTPTPAAIGLMSSPQGGNISTPINRLANPDTTNATLISPETHRVFAPKPLDQLSPSKVSDVQTTSSNILDEAIAHLIKVEPKLAPVIEKHPCKVFSPEGLAEEIDPFNSLVSGIISQQVSGAAAKSIKAKFVALFTLEPGTNFPTPTQVLALDIPTLRTAGLSLRKAEYILGLSTAFHSGALTTPFLLTAPYEDVFNALIAIRGLGKWSVEMFACFSLKRIDVFSTGDLGVQRGMAALKGRDITKLKNGKGKWKFMKEEEMLEISDRFKPYRSVFMWYTWRVADVGLDTFDQ